MEPNKDQAVAHFAGKNLAAFAVAMWKDFKLGWHIEALAKKLEAVERGEIKRLMVFMPPRHCKSLLCSQFFPSWYLGRHPDKQVITATYGDDLARDFGRKVRNLIATQEYHSIFPKVSLAEDSAAIGKFNTSEDGVYIATGIGGAITGRGADCLTGDTLIQTPRGKMRLDNLVYSGYNGLVLSYNHATQKSEYRKVMAVRDKGERDVYEIEARRGFKVRATANHRFYVMGYGYRTLAWITKQGHNNNLRLLFQGETEEGVRYSQGNQKRTFRYVLLSALCSIASFFQEQAQMYKMWRNGSKEDKKVLRQLQDQAQGNAWDAKRLRRMSNAVQANIKSYKVLFDRMQEQIACKVNDWYRQSMVSEWGQSNSAFQSPQAASFQARQGMLRGMQSAAEYSFPSYRSRSQKQRGGKYNNLMFDLPCSSSSLQGHAIHMVRGLRKKERVYDIQVEGNQNFYANGVLVHNCLLIDDPIRNRQDADSEVIREKVWDWYISTARSRLMPNGAVIIIQTRWHTDDLAGRLLKQMAQGDGEKWEVMDFPAIATGTDHRHEGEPLWPEQWSLEELLKTKTAIGSREWNCLYQQTPSDPENQIFHSEMFRYYDEPPTGEMLVLMTVDPAFTQKTTSDYSAIMVVGKKDNKTYVLDYYRGKVQPSELISKIIEYHKKWKPIRLGIEAYSAQKVIGFYLEERAARENLSIAWEAITQQGDKLSKIRRLEPYFRNGEMLFRRWHTELEKELLEFPQGDHDDLIDALQMTYEFKLFDAMPTKDVDYFDDMGITYQSKFNQYGEPIQR